MRTARHILIIIAIALIIIQNIRIDYKDLSWNNNIGIYLSILAMVILIAGMIYSDIMESKKVI